MALGESAPSLVRLTALSNGAGGRVAPALFAEIMRHVNQHAQLLPIPSQIMVGGKSRDEAVVWKLNEHQALVATTEFFTPIVDDPFDFGQIAAAHALSNIYAIGARPLFALAIVGMPVDVLPPEVIANILHGGESMCAKAGIHIAAGHSIDSAEPIYGLTVLGMANPAKVRARHDAQPGDALILAKAVGSGIYAAALRKGKLDAERYTELVTNTTQLNSAEMALAENGSSRATSAVSGLGLAGQILEICRSSGLSVNIKMSSVPLLKHARSMAQAGFMTAASSRNWNSYGQQVRLSSAIMPEQRALLTDPQTNGGLLISCAYERAGGVLEALHHDGFTQAVLIGRFADQRTTTPTLAVEP